MSHDLLKGLDLKAALREYLEKANVCRWQYTSGAWNRLLKYKEAAERLKREIDALERL